MARANPHWKSLRDAPEALAIYSGPQAYVTPGWYATKSEHGKVVPTWNYAVVHIYGRAEVLDDAEWLHAHVSDLSDLQEANRQEPWATSDAPERYMHAMVRGIVGIRLVIDRIEAKAKMSQNQPEQNRIGVANGMLERNTGHDATVAQWVLDASLKRS